MTMLWAPPVTPSSFIERVGYDSDSGTMGIRMRPQAPGAQGREYLYPGTTAEEYIAVLNAQSTGRAFGDFKRRWKARQKDRETAGQEAKS